MTRGPRSLSQDTPSRIGRKYHCFPYRITGSIPSFVFLYFLPNPGLSPKMHDAIHCVPPLFGTSVCCLEKHFQAFYNISADLSIFFRQNVVMVALNVS